VHCNRNWTIQVFEFSQPRSVFADRGEIRIIQQLPHGQLYPLLRPTGGTPGNHQPSRSSISQAMNLSSLVHAGIHRGEQQCSPYAPRPQQIMASSIVTNKYTTQQPSHPSYTYVTAPQPPPSPPVDEASKCSLPSISSLLGGLPSDSSAQETQPQASQQPGK
jgi:hypothetical protein